MEIPDAYPLYSLNGIIYGISIALSPTEVQTVMLTEEVLGEGVCGMFKILERHLYLVARRLTVICGP